MCENISNAFVYYSQCDSAFDVLTVNKSITHVAYFA